VIEECLALADFHASSVLELVSLLTGWLAQENAYL